MRQRNTIVIFLVDDRESRMLQDALVLQDWNVLAATTLNEATVQFRRAGDDLAVVITDSVSRRDEGPHKDMEGINFLRQREVDRFIANVPFVLLMFRANQAIQEWVDQQGGWSVRMPQAKLSVLTDLVERLERDHPRPPRPTLPGRGEL